jgi:hypothetical protein
LAFCAYCPTSFEYICCDIFTSNGIHSSSNFSASSETGLFTLPFIFTGFFVKFHGAFSMPIEILTCVALCSDTINNQFELFKATPGPKLNAKEGSADGACY